MSNFGASRHLFAACLCGAVALAVGSKASGQSAPADACAPPPPFVMPPQTTCDPSLFISTPDAATGPSTPATNKFSLPPLATSTQPPPPPGGDIYQTLGIMNPNATTFTYADVAAPYPDATSCKAFDAQGHTAVHNCLCDSCFTTMQECDALPGCKVIAKCAWDTGCDPSASLTSPTSCYPLAGTGGCVTQINKYGTGSVATSIAQQLGLCGRMKSCPAQ
jgi:hypothetical protein